MWGAGKFKKGCFRVFVPVFFSCWSVELEPSKMLGKPQSSLELDSYLGTESPTGAGRG